MRTLKLRASDALVARIDELAAARGLANRSDAMRAALWADEASPRNEGIPDRDEILRLLTERARDGHVAAMVALMAEIRLGDHEAVSSSAIDDLAKRRRSAKARSSDDRR